MRSFVLIVVLSLASSSTVFAQIENCSHFSEIIEQIVNDAPNPNNVDRPRTLLDVGQGMRCFATFAADRILFRDFVRRFEASRTDKQSGAAGNAAGSTSVVSQGPVAKVLSAAVEYGALTQSVTGQVVTIRGNLAGIPSALVRHNVFPYCVDEERGNAHCVDDSLLGALRRASFSVSFDASSATEVTGTPSGPSPSAGPVTFTADRGQITSASGRVELWQRRDATAQDFQNKWKQQVGTAIGEAAGDLLVKAGAFGDSVRNAAGYDAWHQTHSAQVRAAGRDRALIVAALHAALRELLPIVRASAPDFEAQADAALGAYARFFLAQDELIDTLAAKKIVALEYSTNRPAGQPNTSNLRVIVDWPITRRTKIIGNGAATFYHSLPAGTPEDVNSYRDAQLALQVDHGIEESSILGPATLSAALYYQYQHSPALLKVDPLRPIPGVSFVGLPSGASAVFAEKGHIVLGQVKLTLVPEGSSVKIPVSATLSNRTELIDKPTWRAQVGLTYDFDSLFALAGRLRP